MAQISCRISDELNELMETLAEDTGITKSSLASEFIRAGAYREIEKQMMTAEYLKRRADKKTSKSSGYEKGN